MTFGYLSLTIYLAGILVALWRADAPLLPRVGLALLWPLAVLACVVTLAMLSVAAMVLFPLVGVGVAAVAGALWWYVR